MVKKYDLVEWFGNIMPVTSKELLQELLHPTRKAMEEHGITVDYLIEKGSKLLKAEKTTYQKLRGETVIKGNVVAQTDSEAVVAIGSADSAIQQKQAEMFYRLGGHYPNEKVDHNVNVGIELSEGEAKIAKKAVDYVLKQTLSKKVAPDAKKTTP